MSELVGPVEPASAARRAEARLVVRASRGDADAFTTLVRGYDRPLRALAYRLLEDEGAMDDALQDAYVKAYVGLPAFAGASTFGTWLYRIVYNTCLDELRRRGRRPVLVSAEPPEEPAAGPDPLAAIEHAADLSRALGGLGPELRAAVLLVDAEGLTYDEAAAVLGIPAGTVASRLNRARALLRPALRGEGGDPR